MAYHVYTRRGIVRIKFLDILPILVAIVVTVIFVWWAAY